MVKNETPYPSREIDLRRRYYQDPEMLPTATGSLHRATQLSAPFADLRNPMAWRLSRTRQWGVIARLQAAAHRGFRKVQASHFGLLQASRARIGTTLVLHTWGSALTHHPHVHGIVPGGGLALDADRWVSCKPGFFLSVRVLSRLFRRRFIEELQNAHRRGQLKFYGEHIDLSDTNAFADWLSPLRQCEWVVYAKRPFAGPEAVLAYLSRYTHRVAISNSWLIASDERGVTFR